MILFLTKSQIKNLNKAKRDKTNYKLIIKNDQLQIIGNTLFILNRKLENLHKKNKLGKIISWLKLYRFLNNYYLKIRYFSQFCELPYNVFLVFLY